MARKPGSTGLRDRGQQDCRGNHIFLRIGRKALVQEAGGGISKQVPAIEASSALPSLAAHC